MNAETETFIHDLFARWDEGSQPGYITLTAIHPDGDKPTPSRHIRLNHDIELERAMAILRSANERGWGAYVGVAPRNRDFGRWTRGTKRDLTCLPALFVDIDKPDDALIRLGWFDLPASCILRSGHGYHAYWFLDPPTTDFLQADKLLRGLAQRLNGDEILTVAQSMRLPGTINTKAGRNDTECHFVGYHPERLYDLGEFRPFLPKVLAYPQHRSSWQYHERDRHELPRTVIDALTDAVLHQLDGRWRPKGFIGAYCPFPHAKDRPGMHFSYHAETGWGQCFGKHGKIPPTELCKQLGITIYDRSSSAAA